MKTFSQFAASVVFATAAFGGVINIATGTNNANWQVTGPGIPVAVTATSLTVAQQNGTWAPAPISISPISGANWLSYGSIEGTSCVVGQTPGNGCAHTLVNPAGDTWIYTLNISAATLGTNSGTANFIFGADNDVTVVVGIGGASQTWNPGAADAAFNPLGCSGTPPTSAGNTQAQYNNCTGTVSYNAANLNGDGSLTLTASVTNSPIVGCPACGDPTGFVLEGTISTGPNIPVAPEPATFALVGLAGLSGLILRRKK